MHSDMSVDEIMRIWPTTIEVMLRHKMLCVGCPVGGFHSVREACLAHDVDEAALMAELRHAIGDPAATPACDSRR